MEHSTVTGSLMLTRNSVLQIQRALGDAGVDGWLIYDFHGLNPIATGMLNLPGMATRRIFVFIPRDGDPIAITHAIEQGPWRDWPSQWGKKVYSSWRSLESEIGSLVKGKKVAMEYSPGDAVPYLDRIPAGVLEMVRAAGATVVSSADLVTQFYATWTDEQLASHRRAAEALASIVKEAGKKAGEGTCTEFEVQQWILERFATAGLQADHGPIVAIGPNAANPHYEPSAENSPRIKRGDVLLIDLWAREPNGIFADQTWMFSLGEPSAEHKKIWEAVRDGRDAAIALLRDRLGSGQALSGGEVDDACRAVIDSRGFGQNFIHRTGHSIDARDLHGSGPHIDNLETREERLLVPGVGFSIEPGVYIAREVGMRSEVNAFVQERGVLITPADIQTELIVV
jgi:Xaa-Pro aminopeptidase